MEHIQEIIGNMYELRSTVIDYEEQIRKLKIKNKVLKKSEKLWKRITKSHEQTISDYQKVIKKLSKNMSGGATLIKENDMMVQSELQQKIKKEVTVVTTDADVLFIDCPKKNTPCVVDVDLTVLPEQLDNGSVSSLEPEEDEFEEGDVEEYEEETEEVEGEEETEEVEVEGEEEETEEVEVEGEEEETEEVEGEEEETEEAYQVVIRGKKYFTTNEINGEIYHCIISSDGEEEIGDEAGVYQNGTPNLL